MVNKIIDGISKAINTKFGDSKEIYTESVEQGLNPPCFLIECIDSDNNRVIKDRYKTQNQFCIHYFPSIDTKEKRAECFDVLNDLYDCLDKITLENDLVLGSEKRGKVDDEVLHFFINFDFFIIIKNNEDNLFESYSAETKIKG